MKLQTIDVVCVGGGGGGGGGYRLWRATEQNQHASTLKNVPHMDKMKRDLSRLLRHSIEGFYLTGRHFGSLGVF
jgi:hypothetical protein